MSTRRRLPLWLRLSILGMLALVAVGTTRALMKARRQPAADAPLVEFTVDGLDCPVWCAVRLSESIDRLDGARVESLDRNTGKVVVRHDPRRQNVAALRRVFTARGFAVQATAPVPASR